MMVKAAVTSADHWME